MARKKKTPQRVEVENYSHKKASRKNIPPAKIASEGRIPKAAKASYSYSPHLTPELRFDPDGDADRVAAIVEKSCSGQALTAKEQAILRTLAQSVEQPWLEWSGKIEEHNRGRLEVDPVTLHIHERISSNAIVRAAMRKDVQRTLFADPEMEYQKVVQFYKHDIDWANRLILGDSMQVMSSLARREDLAGKVQMIYIDPPYGIKFASNFQPEVGQRDVKDKEADLTREPEMVKAYRDTWHLGIHSYLSYLRNRMLIARELMNNSGSIFVQINDENLHLVRQVIGEVFGADNFMGVIPFRVKSPLGVQYLGRSVDYLIWYAKDRKSVTYRQLYIQKRAEDQSEFSTVELSCGQRLSLSAYSNTLSCADRVMTQQNLASSGYTPSCTFIFSYAGNTYPSPKGRSWKTNLSGMNRLANAERLIGLKSSLRYAYYLDDFAVREISDIWADTFAAPDKQYVVETDTEVIKRCMLMTTDPSDLVLDPTCGSGTTAYVAEQWGRRWITIDTSRVALALARQRLLTAKFDRYRVQGESPAGSATTSGKGIDPSENFVYMTIPHIKLASIARNENLDPIFAKHEPILDDKLVALNQALSEIPDKLCKQLVAKLALKMQDKGLRAATDADRRRWIMPGTTKEHIETAFVGKPKLKAKHIKDHVAMVPSDNKFEHWHVPFDTDPDWPESLKEAVTGYRKAWRAKMDEVNACISANAGQETLVDQPEMVSGVMRVTGPLTVEGVRPEELSIDEHGELFDPTPNEWDEDGHDDIAAQNASAYLDRMLQLLDNDGVTFPNNEHRGFARIEPLYEIDSALHAEGVWVTKDDDSNNDTACNVAIAFGPQYGPVTAEQVEDLIRASRRYDELVVAAFSFDGASQEIIQESANPRLKIHMAHIRPDVSPGMDGLLKDTPNSQLFTVFGQPEIEVRTNDDGEVEVELLGVDIYSPLTGEVHSAGASKVAAWFLDSDYDGRCFCITQAFFPDRNAWDKIAKALGSAADKDAFDAYKGTVSLPFEPGKHKRIAVKLIDPRGNEVMAIRSLKQGE